MRILPIACTAALLIATAGGAQTRAPNEMHDGPRLDAGQQLNTDSHTAGRSPEQAAMAKRLQNGTSAKCHMVKGRHGQSMKHCVKAK